MIATPFPACCGAYIINGFSGKEKEVLPKLERLVKDFGKTYQLFAIVTKYHDPDFVQKSHVKRYYGKEWLTQEEFIPHLEKLGFKHVFTHPGNHGDNYNNLTFIRGVAVDKTGKRKVSKASTFEIAIAPG